jgi:hypothetical protein
MHGAPCNIQDNRIFYRIGVKQSDLRTIADPMRGFTMSKARMLPLYHCLPPIHRI